MEILINNDQQQFDVDDLLSLIEQVVTVGLKVLAIDDEGEVSITLVDNAMIQELNRTYRGKDQPTDVLSFPQDDQDFGDLSIGRMLGDIVISLERANEQAVDYNHSFSREVGYLTAHGLLHLAGYDHQTQEDKALMRKKEEEIMTHLKLGRD